VVLLPVVLVEDDALLEGVVAADWSGVVAVVLLPGVVVADDALLEGVVAADWSGLLVTGGVAFGLLAVSVEVLLGGVAGAVVLEAALCASLAAPCAWVAAPCAVLAAFCAVLAAPCAVLAAPCAVVEAPCSAAWPVDVAAPVIAPVAAPAAAPVAAAAPLFEDWSALEVVLGQLSEIIFTDVTLIVPLASAAPTTSTT